MACKKKSLSSRLRHVVIIQKRTQAAGTTGELEDTWTDHLSIRASVEPAIGREYFQAYQEQNENMVKFRTRWARSIDAVNPRDYRISFKSDIYDIESVINVFEHNKEMIIMARLFNG